jgi:hypothetical protein
MGHCRRGFALRSYVGAFIAAAFPLSLAAAVDPGWSMVLETALLFLFLETVTGQMIEPQLFGHTTGLSPLAVVVAAAFGTSIWGPPGLLLSTPITACLVVLGRHVESLNFIEVLLGDKPALSPVQSFYQRILASDPDEIAFQAESLLKNMALIDYYEEVALPALALAQADVTRGVMEVSRQREVRASVEHVVADLSDHFDESVERGDPDDKAPWDGLLREPDVATPTARSALCMAGRTPLDQAACAILAQLLERPHVSARVAGPQALTTSGIFGLSAEAVDAICVVYLDQQSMAAIRYSIRRLRKKYPATAIAVFLWGNSDPSVMKVAAGADAVFASLQGAVDFCSGSEESRPPTISRDEAPVRLVAS